MSRFTITRRKFLTYSGLVAGAALIPITGTSDKSLRFGLVTDTHYADRAAAGKRYYRQSKGKLEECVELMNREKVDFLIHLGDFKDQDEEPIESNTLRYLKDLEKVFQGYDGPTYHVIGNHDVDSISKEQFLENVENTGISTKRSYYSFDHKEIHFLVLDANFRADNQSYHKGNFDWRDPNIPEHQLRWLEKDLQTTELPAIVFIHQPLDGTDHYFVKNADQVRKMLEDHGKVLAVFQGHKHQEHHSQINGIHYCTFLAMVEGEGKENSCYTIVEMQADGILLTGYRRASSNRLMI